MNGLVWIGKVVQVNEIPLAERIESLEVILGRGGKWLGVSIKNQFSVGDSCEVYLPDSMVPHSDRFLFMSRMNYRVRMIRLRGVPSECLIMPRTLPGDVGDDVTDAAGVTKYEKPMPANLDGMTAGPFPNFIPKTDEPNFQSVPKMVQALLGRHFYSTVKCDGSSGTVYRFQDHFGVCSRGHELVDGPNAFWKCVRDTELDQTMPEGYALQFECVGPKIQGNTMGLKQVEPRFFNLYEIGVGYLGYDALHNFCVFNKLPMVPLLFLGRFGSTDYPADDDSLRLHAESAKYFDRTAEGVVIRPIDEMTVSGKRLSFKILNLSYKEK